MDSQQLTLWGDRSTSSPGSAAGPAPSVSPASLTTPLSGPAPVPVSPSASPGGAVASTMCAICGRSCGALSPSACLQSSLESRLRQRLEGSGSTLYALTWKHWAMPSGPPICALRASAPRTSGSACSGEPSGWATPVSNDATGSTHCYGPKRPDGTRDRYLKLPGQAAMAGCPTVRASDVNGGVRDARLDAGPDLRTAAGWATPVARDYRSPNRLPFAERGGGFKGEQLANQARHLPRPGELTDGSSAPTDDRGRLHPSHAGWMMGYPREWDSCGATATRLSRKSRRSS